MAAHLDGRDPLPLCRPAHAGHPAVDELDGLDAVADPGLKAAALVAGRIKPGRLHRGLQLGGSTDGGIPCRPLPGRVAGVGAVVGPPVLLIGHTVPEPVLRVHQGAAPLFEASLAELQAAWSAPLAAVFHGG